MIVLIINLVISLFITFYLYTGFIVEKGFTLAKKITNPPLIDGQLTDECWRALNVNLDAKIGSIWSVYDDNALYITGLVDTALLNKQIKENTTIWETDHIELIVLSRENGKQRIRIAAHPTYRTQVFREVLVDDKWKIDKELKEGINMPGYYKYKVCIIEAQISWKTITDNKPASVLIALGVAEPGKEIAPVWKIIDIEKPVLVPKVEDEEVKKLVNGILASQQKTIEREKAISKLSSTRNIEAVPSLVPLFEIDNPDIQNAAAKALKSMDEDKVITETRKWYFSQKHSTKSKVTTVKFLQELKNEEKFLFMLEIMAKDDNHEVKMLANNVLKKPEAAPTLIASLNKNPDSEVRRTAITTIALAQLKDPNLMPALETALSNDKEWAVRIAAADALGKLNETQAIPALSSALTKDPEPAVRVGIAKILAASNDPRAVVDLITTLRTDSSALVRLEACRALGNLNDPSAVPALQAALQDSDAAVRQAATEALTRFK